MRGGGALTWLRRSAGPISRRSSTNATVIAIAVKMPIAIWVCRQPMVCTPQFTTGGQIVPPT